MHNVMGISEISHFIEQCLDCSGIHLTGYIYVVGIATYNTHSPHNRLAYITCHGALRCVVGMPRNLCPNH